MTMILENPRSILPSQRNWWPTNKYMVLVNDLRDSAPPGEVKVYHQNPDGTRGELIRIESPDI